MKQLPVILNYDVKEFSLRNRWAQVANVLIVVNRGMCDNVDGPLIGGQTKQIAAVFVIGAHFILILSLFLLFVEIWCLWVLYVWNKQSAANILYYYYYYY